MNQAEVKGTNCPVCCTEIQHGEDTTICPHCNMPYHKDCWNDNHGCATYGCKSSGCLNPPPMTIDVNADEPAPNLPQGISVCPQCHTQLGAGIVFCWKCGAKLGSRAVLNVADAPLAGAWTRWAARIMDYTLESFLVAFCIGMIGDISSVSEVVAGIIFCPFVICLDSAVYGILGNTLGKWLFGVKVVDFVGRGISGKEYFGRNWRVYWGGFGLGIPIVTLCTFVTQYNRVSKGTPATYDEILKLKSISHGNSQLKSFLGVMSFIIILIVRIGVSINEN